MAVLEGVEDRYNRPATMQMSFQQSLTGGGRISRTERGQLFLARPGKMLWEYRLPNGKFFLVDGKNVWFYTPNTERVEKSPVKESDDMRAPLSLLLGRLDFRKYFDEFRSKPVGEDLLIVAKPKSDRAPYTEVEFQVTPKFEINRLRVVGFDNSVMEFEFADLRTNPRLEAGLFEFQAPPGAEIVEVEDP